MSSNEELEKKYSICVDYMMDIVKKTTKQMKKDKITEVVIDLDIKQCEPFMTSTSVEKIGEINKFEYKTIYKNNMIIKLDPFQYVSNSFSKYKLSSYTGTLDYEKVYFKHPDAKKLVIKKKEK